MELTFLGATGTVTGSKYLIKQDNKQFLIDCGLFQGYKELRLRNWAPFPISPTDIDAVILTHAHIDHSGYLPLLVKNGFKGSIYATKGTKDLCGILLPDSGFLQEEDARRANKYGYSKHTPALPLYTKEDAVIALKQFNGLDFGKWYQLNDNLQMEYYRAGHILGAAFVKLQSNDTTLLFTGDMGRSHDPIMNPPATIQYVDYLVLESTYGNRLHEAEDPEEKIAKIINDTTKRGGKIIIPAFAVGRAQHMLYYLYRLKQAKRIPDIKVFLDSPMAINATEIMRNHHSDHHLSERECANIFDSVTYVVTQEESKKLKDITMPIIIISANGMATGGRILHHLKEHISNPRDTILFTGYQAGGTRGARLIQGEKEVKIHGELYPVRANIENISSMSAHADYEEILGWLGKFTKPPRKVFLTHGEPEAAQSLKEKIEKRLGWNVVVPEYLQSESL